MKTNFKDLYALLPPVSAFYINILVSSPSQVFLQTHLVCIRL